MRLKVVVIENDEATLRILNEQMDWASLDCELAGQAADGEAGRQLILEKKPDIILSGIHISKMNGLDMLESIRPALPESKIILITKHARFPYALRAIKLGACDYLLKPVELADLKRAVARCKMSGGGIDVQALLSSLTAPQPARKEYKERYLVRFNDRIIPISTAEIAYVYSEEKSNYLVTFDSHKYIIDSSLDVIIEELDPAVFFRISRGCIIAINAISSIIKQMGGRLKIISKPESSFEMMVSRSRVDDFLEWMEK